MFGLFRRLKAVEDLHAKLIDGDELVDRLNEIYNIVAAPGFKATAQPVASIQDIRSIIQSEIQQQTNALAGMVEMDLEKVIEALKGSHRRVSSDFDTVAEQLSSFKAASVSLSSDFDELGERVLQLEAVVSKLRDDFKKAAATKAKPKR